MAKITKTISLALSEGALGDVAGTTSSYEREVEAALANNHVARSQALTTSWEDLDVGDIDVTKIYEVHFHNHAAADATNYVQVAVYDGTNRIIVARVLPQNGGAWPAEPQASGYPKIQVRVNSGTGSVTVKAIEAGTPPA